MSEPILKTVTSGGVTFMDLTDSRKLEAYITSNLPIVQIYNQNENTDTYTPDWSETNLQLSADIYLDAKEVTSDAYTSITWYKKVGTQAAIPQIGTGAKLTINNNQLTGDIGIITYICEAKYKDTTINTPTAHAEITFTRVDTGLNGSNGADAPVVLAQYSVDGSTDWTTTLNTTTHKYVRHSYDGGSTWSMAIKMVGEDGTSVRIIGTAISATQVSGTNYYTLIYSSGSITSAEIGDAYLYNGDLYVCIDSRDGQDYFINVGNIQGPKGSDGQSSYVFIRYATDDNGTNMSTSPDGKTYMGIYTSDTNVPPNTADVYTWSKFVGDNAKSIVLSGDSQVFKVDKSNSTTPLKINVTAQAFNTTITNWTYSTNGGETFQSSTPIGVVRSGNTVIVDGASLTSDSITIKASDGKIEDVFTVYKAFDGIDGNPGDSASIAFLTNESVTFNANSQGQISGTTITSNIVAYNGTTKVLPTLGTITGVPTGMTITSLEDDVSNEITLTIAIEDKSTLNFTSGTIYIPINTPISTVLSLNWNTVKAGANGAKGDPGVAGADAYTVLLTNESHTFAGDISNAIVGSASTQIVAYKGSAAQPVTITSVNGVAASTVDVATGIDGLKFKCSTLSGESPTITFTCTTAFKNTNGSIPIKLSVGGISFTKMFTYSIAFKGATGSTGPTGSTGMPATSYWLVSNASVVQKTSTGTITVTPSALTFTGKSQTGMATPIDYACRWIIAYSTDGTNYTNLYTSSANEASKSVTVSTTYKTIRVRMYLAGGTSTLLDEQIIPIISDGAKGDTGNGINSVTVTYGTSTSASTQPTSWQATIPTVAEGSYLWTRTVTDYTDSSIADTVTYTYAKQGAQGNIGPQGTSVAVSSIQYQAGTSATTAPTGTWSNSVVTVAEGSYLWTKTTFSDGKIAYGVARQGIDGDDGVGVKSVTEYYLATSSGSGVVVGTPGWTTTVQTITLDKKYLWNYEVITYTNNTTSTTTPIIIGVYGNTGNTGKGISSVTEYYLATASSSNVTTSTSGWATTMQTLTATNKYLWNYELITYTDNTTYTVNPVIIGVYGDKGDKGNQGDKGLDAYTVILTNESHIFAGTVSSAVASSATTQVMAYKGGTSQSVTIVSVNGVAASTSSTATGITGLSFSCSALSGTSPTITFACTTSFVSTNGTIPVVISVGGVQFTKIFTYGIAFKGATGSTGTAASLVDITPSAHYFKSTTGKDGTFTPEYIYLYPRFQTVTYSKWEYSVDGGTTWVAASVANGLSISTYNSVANTLRIAKTSTLYTDTVTSISFRCVSSNASVYDTVSIAKIYDVVDFNIGGRNYILNSANLSVSGLGSSAGSRAEYRTIDVGQSYMSIENNTEVTISFDLEMTVNTANPTLMVYNSNRLGPKIIASKSLKFTASVGDTIKQRCSVVTQITDRENPSLTSNTIEFYSTYDTSNWFKISNLKLEKGNKATDWSPAPEDLKSVTLQLYAPKGYLITKDVPEVTLETFAYDGSQPITEATFEWYSLTNDVWTIISGATGTSLTLNKDSILKSNVYKCKMTYKDKTYESTATVEDKTDIYESIMCISSNARGNNCYWVLYTLVYTDAEEIDPLLGPISINAPSSPVSGDYWYAVDETNASVQLKKYNGTSWANSTDTQSLSYYWDIINNGSEKVPFGDHSKVQVVSCNDFTATATLVCGVNNAEDGLLTQSSLSLTDASDPIVSTTEPSNVVDGQIWIKPNNNGTYIMSIWDATNAMWVVGDMDTRTKVHTSKPSSYSVGDLWITASDTEHSGYLEGTLLMANTSSSTFSESHWSTTLKYDKDLDSIKETLNDLSQYVNITSEGLKIGAQSSSGEISPFTSLFTSTELAFYQNSDKLLTLANNQLTAPHIVVEDDLEVGKTISLGNLTLTIENNGSFSFAVSK